MRVSGRRLALDLHVDVLLSRPMLSEPVHHRLHRGQTTTRHKLHLYVVRLRPDVLAFLRRLVLDTHPFSLISAAVAPARDSPR